MPKRDRLASTVFREGSLRDTVGRQVMQDLTALCSTRAHQTYCTTLNKIALICDTYRLASIPGKVHNVVVACLPLPQAVTEKYRQLCRVLLLVFLVV